MKNMELPKDAQNEVRLYLITTQGTQYEQKQLQEFLKIISPSLNQKVSVEIFTSTVNKNQQLKTAIGSISREQGVKEEELIKPIVQRMETQLSEPDQIIVKQYQEGNAIYLISKGECNVIVGEQSQKSIRVSTKPKGKKRTDDDKRE